MTKFFSKTQLEPGQRPMFTRQELIRLIIPLMIEQLLAITIGMADSVMVASCGEASVSGVSLVDSINVLLINVFSALTTGGAIVASQYLGRQDVKQANIATKQLFMSTFALSAAIMAVCLMFQTPILYGIFGHVESSVMQNCEIYFFWSALSYPFLGIYNSGAAIYRSMGNSKISMFTSVIMNLWNVCGNAILIFGFGMGVAGAAIATFTSRILGAVLIVLLLHIQHNPIRLDSLQGFFPKMGNGQEHFEDWRAHWFGKRNVSGRKNFGSGFGCIFWNGFYCSQRSIWSNCRAASHSRLCYRSCNGDGSRPMHGSWRDKTGKKLYKKANVASLQLDGGHLYSDDDFFKPYFKYLSVER